MITIRKAKERGLSQIDWLESWHSFSFDRYYDPAHMGFRSLRVINEDTVAPGKGFGTHPHRDMEIITYVTEGVLEHKDSTGATGLIKPGEIQRMTAGSGIAHSEYNHHKDKPVHLLQIWIMPETKGLTPGYEQIAYPVNTNTLQLIGTRVPTKGAVTIHQDIKLYRAALQQKKAVSHALMPSRAAWLQVVKGVVTVNGSRAEAGDGVSAQKVELLQIEAGDEGGEFLLFDLA